VLKKKALSGLGNVKMARRALAFSKRFQASRKKMLGKGGVPRREGKRISQRRDRLSVDRAPSFGVDIWDMPYGAW